MRIIIQRVSHCSVVVDGSPTGKCDLGLLLLIGIAPQDDERVLAWMANKVLRMRIFRDSEGKMNRSVSDVSGGIVAVSQFTLLGDVRKGHRPSFIGAAPPEVAEPAYLRFCTLLEEGLGRPVGRGVFGAHMEVHLCNDGPVTIVLDSQN